MNVVGTMLYGGDNASNPSGQVVATLKFLQASLNGATNPTILNAYLKVLEEQGRAFLAYKNTAQGATTPMNFGQWVLDRLGPNGGLG
jgi:isocitrate/isopropylmalate dehydrogenase